MYTHTIGVHIRFCLVEDWTFFIRKLCKFKKEEEEEKGVFLVLFLLLLRTKTMVSCLVTIL